MKLLHAFSPSMLGHGWEPKSLCFQRFRIEQVREILHHDGVESHVKHANLASILTEQLEITIPVNDGPIKLLPCIPVIVAQYYGPMMAIDQKKMPANGQLRFYQVMIIGGILIQKEKTANLKDSTHGHMVEFDS
jgi:hypothetical protein